MAVVRYRGVIMNCSGHTLKKRRVMILKNECRSCVHNELSPRTCLHRIIGRSCDPHYGKKLDDGRRGCFHGRVEVHVPGKSRYILRTLVVCMYYQVYLQSANLSSRIATWSLSEVKESLFEDSIVSMLLMFLARIAFVSLSCNHK